MIPPRWRVLGTIDQRAGINHLEEAVDVLGGSQARLEHAKSPAALGARVRGVQRPRKARAHLREALELAKHCGAGFVADVRSELYAAGGRPRRTAVTGVEALTVSERRGRPPRRKRRHQPENRPDTACGPQNG